MTERAAGTAPLGTTLTYQGQVFVRKPGRPSLPSSDPITPLLSSAGHTNPAESKMPQKLGLGTRENYGRKIGKLPGLWASWGIPEEEFLGETELHQGP